MRKTSAIKSTENFLVCAREQIKYQIRVFWLDKGGKARLWYDKDYSYPLLVIPFRNEHGLIQACRMRFMSEALFSSHYACLSTLDKFEGSSKGSPLHFAGGNQPSASNAFLVTEKTLKAETVKVFKPNLRVLASVGVACFYKKIVSVSRFQPVILAFDQNYAENKHVARAIAKHIVSRFKVRGDFNYDFNLSVLYSLWD